MVFCVREREGNKQDDFMAMVPERSSSSSKPLHNFTLPYLKWGNQRHLRCMKLDDSSPTSSSDQRFRRRSPPSRLSNCSTALVRKESDDVRHKKDKLLSKSGTNGCVGGHDDDEEGIDAVREKIMNDLKTAADKMKDEILREEVSDDEDREESPVTAAAQVESEVRPWNLRTRRAACKAPIGGAPATPSTSKGFKIEDRKRSSSPMTTDVVGAKSPRLIRGGGEKEVKKERPKFAVNLSKKEIEEDFMELLGHRPPRRPKKRPRAVQKQLDCLFPGLWLTEVTVDSYKVPELAENGKR